MSVIQKIQDKYAKLMAVIIAVALIIFVIMLAFENGGSLFNSSNSTTIGSVNGKKIEYNEFQQLVDRQENYMQQQGYNTGEALSQQAISATWNQEVSRLLMVSELDKLDMQVGKKELGDILYGTNPPADLKQQFTDKTTGQYNAQQAKSAIDQMLKAGTAEQVAQVSSYIDQLEFNRMNEKYVSLLTNSTNFPKWQIEKENADNSQLAKVSFVREFYSSIPDSTIKISDEEIKEYINKHKKQYEQPETRGIAYVAFSALPTAADSTAARESLLALKPAFDSTKNVAEFLESQGVTTYYDSYISGGRLQVPSKDSILKIDVGQIYGPYLDGNNYSLAKMVGKRVQPDTVKVRHILISTSNRDTATAKKLVDSLQTALKGGANFDTLCAKYSEDPGSKDKGGVYESVPSGQMVPSFNDFIFGNGVGAKGVVKTSYGYHYIEILSQKGSSPAYKVAYLSTPITASNETDNNAHNLATKFAGDSRDKKSFDANAEKLKSQNINKLLIPGITPDAFELPSLGISRQFIKDIYSADLGDVLQPERVGDHWVVAIVTEVNEKGTQSVATARPSVEPALRNHKKAEQIIKKAGKVTTLEAAAAAWGGKIIETADSVRLHLADGQMQSPLVAREPKIVGAAFNPANKGKVVPEFIEGIGGVFIVRVDDVTATSVSSADIGSQRQIRYQQAKMRGAYPQQALKEAATIKDNRSKFF